MGKDDNNTHVVGKVWENTRKAGENFDKGLILYDKRKIWWLMCFISTVHFMSHSYKALNESKENKVTNEPKDKNGMQVWLAKVPLRKNSCEFWKGIRKKYSHMLKDNLILNKADNQSFEIVAKGPCHISRGR